MLYKKTLWMLLLPLLLSTRSGAQSSVSTIREYARKPLWIGMMEDTTANYFEVEKAFNTYFGHHELPAGEEEEINEHREREKIPSKRRQRKISAENKLRMNVKRYYRWREDMLPYVQEGGRILSPAERIAIWKQQGK